jgi:ketosteroid isomerase-like protein
MDSGVKSLAFTVVDVGSSGEIAHETGIARMNIQAQGKEPTTAAVKYVVVWKLQGDDWKLHRDIWNDLPAK